MTKIVLYIATSLDGYIARKDGSIDWLTAFETDETDHGYGEFYRSIDGLAMGRKTYEQVLSFGEWPHPGKPSYVFTQQSRSPDRDDVLFTSATPDRFLHEMELQGLKRIWLVGGAELIASFLQCQLIDEYILSIAPIMLGEGIPLFLPSPMEMKLKLIEVQKYPTELVQVRYTKYKSK
ncbi:MAG: dihydrofolate reductase [Microcoleus sp. PH2017_29_MFU_D_A]|jgi:dihydrofolate reductase|uniref:dihydrofolate reductase family protein n=1 Tax=unclassified Microcoleus TaxID=2642155 RepID=UPI001E1028E7|nr:MULTISPECIES: dihydrofolate reductase family protein [unclassified Microcoleus]MCC3419940.1 dihydrofolate reductase [Microcoleus sp. PH2017_07_MST_O_A]MCC3429276.1 dihydrofolate reductase [Microcoleus sp. PH2017_04_SCI_O_A]MCC3440405.1 dihydrofolate reductase [Microcoleus sp. PH2017_03_ELD_O_A]MCC3466585.1 dihydrofolate reductase [Microcoleus sp. PH2017_06_SFM_O_A]MCC3501693.1 dihydrofolate reductase [Microcoleus sp. PH2017_19_SFW_U_A]MCC3509027.1 dihydrofolate reductase [Microcoleus sp. P